MEFNTDSEFDSGFKMAVALLKKRTQIIKDAYSIPDWHDMLVETESRYHEFVKDLAVAAQAHKDQMLTFLTNDKDDPLLAVASHILFIEGTSWALDMIDTICDDEESKRYRFSLRMLHLCTDEQISQISQHLLSSNRHWVSPLLADVIGARGIEKFEDSLMQHLIDPGSGLHRDEIIAALARIGGDQSRTLLKTEIGRLDRGEEYDTMSNLAVGLYIMGCEEGPAFYLNELSLEDNWEYDTAWWIARFGTKEDVSFFIQRLKDTTVEGWRLELLRALGFIGSTAVCPTLIEYMEAGEDEEAEDIRCAADESMAELFGLNADADPTDDSDELQTWWQEWWQEHSANYDTAVRWRYGEPINLQYWLDMLQGPVATDRKAAHEALMIYTGQRFPFDYSAYISKQDEQIKVWGDWLDENESRFPNGAWWRFGNIL